MKVQKGASDKIRVLQFVNTLDFGGATDYALTLCENIDSAQFETCLASGPGSGWEDRANSCNEDVLLLDMMKPTHTEETDNTIFGDMVALFLLYKYLRNHKIDVIHSHGSKSRLLGGLAAWLARTPVRIHSAHGFAFNSRMPRWKFILFVRLEKIMGWLHHDLILESAHDLREAERYKLSKRAMCIYTGIHLEEPTDPEVVTDLRGQLGLTSDTVMVLMVGRLTEQKDPHTFVRAALSANEQVASTVFVVVGDGDLYDSTVKLAAGSDRVKLLGRRTDVKQLIDACDVYMLTSRWEGVPLTILAAMTAGKPVIATNKLGLPEVVIDGETGFLASEGEPDEYANAVSRLAGDKSLRTKFGNSGSGLVRSRHMLSSMIDNFEKLYQYH